MEKPPEYLMTVQKDGEDKWSLYGLEDPCGLGVWDRQKNAGRRVPVSVIVRLCELLMEGVENEKG